MVVKRVAIFWFSLYDKSIYFDRLCRRCYMGYTKLKDLVDRTENNIEFTFEEAVLRFIREDCEGLRFDEKRKRKRQKTEYIWEPV